MRREPDAPAIYGAYHHVTVLGKEDQPCDHKYDVTGSFARTATNLPWIVCCRKLNAAICCLSTTPAPTASMGYNYNGKLKSAEILLKTDGTFQMIRRAETPKDYFATFDCFDFYDDLIKG